MKTIKLNAAQLRNIISETVKGSRRRSLRESPVPPADTILDDRATTTAVMDDERVITAIDDLMWEFLNRLDAVLGLDHKGQFDRVIGRLRTEVFALMEDWVKNFAQDNFGLHGESRRRVSESDSSTEEAIDSISHGGEMEELLDALLGSFIDSLGSVLGYRGEQLISLEEAFQVDVRNELVDLIRKHARKIVVNF